MTAFIFCLIIGFLQTALLSVVLKGALCGEMKKTVIALLSKLAVYAVGFTVLYFFFLNSVIYAGAGFIAGVVASVIFVVIKSKNSNNFKSVKGDDTSDNSRAD